VILRLRSAERHVWLERQHNAIGVVAHNQDWPWYAGDPIRAIGCARLLVPIGQKVLRRYRRLDAADPAHVDRQNFGACAGL